MKAYIEVLLLIEKETTEENPYPATLMEIEKWFRKNGMVFNPAYTPQTKPVIEIQL